MKASMMPCRNSMETVRFFADTVGLVAWRGLWDKFAPPDMLAACRRAVTKGIPLLVDLSRSSISLYDLAVSFAGTDLPLVVVTDAKIQAQEAVSELSGCETLLIVERSLNAPCPVCVVEDGVPVKRGLYLPVHALMQREYVEDGVRAAEMIMFESVDTILSLSEKRSCRYLPDDGVVSRRLRSVMSPDAILFKVSDLVERELLLHGPFRGFA